jgi:hypothetical protein
MIRIMFPLGRNYAKHSKHLQANNVQRRKPHMSNMQLGAEPESVLLRGGTRIYGIRGRYKQQSI